MTSELIGDSFNIAVTSASPRHADDAVQALMAELNDIPRVGVGLSQGGPAPPGSKAVGLGLAEIVVALGGFGSVLPTVIGAVRDWLVRQPPATTLRVKDGDFEFEWSGATPPAQLDALLTELIERRRR